MQFADVLESIHPDRQDQEIAELRARLAEAEDALTALRTGAADALFCEAGVLYLSGAENTYVTFFGAMNEGGVTLDGAGAIVFCNPRFAAMMEQTVDELRGRLLLSCVAEADHAQIKTFLASDGSSACEVTLAIKRLGGWPVRLSLTHLAAGCRRFDCLVVTDLTKSLITEHELECLVDERVGKLRLAASVFENTLQGVMVTDTNCVILSVNPAFTDITGYSAEEATGRKPSILRSQHHDIRFYERLWATLSVEGRWQGEIWNRRKNGEAYLQWSTINLLPAQHGQPACYVAVFADVTDFWRKDVKIAHLAYHDPLTDLPNRTLLLDRLTHAVMVAERQSNQLGVLFIDLDGFKAVNDRLGHHAGDCLLQEMARRLKTCVRSADTVARIGGDEFVVLMEKLVCPAESTILAEKLCSALLWENVEGVSIIRTGASVGIAVYPDDGLDAATLLQNADAALYAAKAAGRGRYCQFKSTDMRPELRA